MQSNKHSSRRTQSCHRQFLGRFQFRNLTEYLSVLEGAQMQMWGYQLFPSSTIYKRSVARLSSGTSMTVKHFEQEIKASHKGAITALLHSHHGT